MSTESRYEIIDEAHGEGGFGKIQKRRDKFLDRFVAVKHLHLFKDHDARERFKLEAKSLAKMGHPNVPAIYDVEFGDEQMFIYFEFIEGRSMRELVNSGTVPSIDKARRWFTQVSAALDHAHSKGIIHRDIKPDNIIVSTNDENATLVDFGIALNSDDVKRLTKKGYAIGTPAYMSPEQHNGEQLDGRSDLYSLGITLYETLSGHLPHPGGYQSLSDANEAIPPAIDDLIQKCLVQDKNGRISSAAEFIKQLRSAFRTDVPLSTLLTEARLHELIAALQQMSAEDFGAKPRGQKLLLIVRLKDLLRIDRSELKMATVQLIELLTRLARFESEQDYAPIVEAAYLWGFDKHFGLNWQGDQSIRDALSEAARFANESAHPVISKAMLAFLKSKDISSLQGWYCHDLRIIAMNLLANPVCGGDNADQLAALYDEVNKASH